MSFPWNQPIYPDTQSQDSGIDPGFSNAGNRQSRFNRPASLGPNSRRTLPRPPSWPHVGMGNSDSGRWKFSREPHLQQHHHQETPNGSQLVRDIHGHLSDIEEIVKKKLSKKMSSLVHEIIKFLQDLYSKTCSETSKSIEEVCDAIKSSDILEDDINSPKDFENILVATSELKLLIKSCSDSYEAFDMSIREKLEQFLKYSEDLDADLCVISDKKVPDMIATNFENKPTALPSVRSLTNLQTSSNIAPHVVKRETLKYDEYQFSVTMFD